MLNKVLGLISGHLHKDSRSSSPARSPKGLQTDQVSHGAVHATISSNSPEVPVNHSQQPLRAAVPHGTNSNGSGVHREAPAAAYVNTNSAAPQPVAHQSTGCSDADAAIQGDTTCRTPPAVPPLAPGTVVRTSSAGSSTMVSRKSSLLSSACRASSRTSTPAQQHQNLEVAFQQLECQQPARSAVTGLPSPLAPGDKDHGTPPPSVAIEQPCGPNQTLQQQPVAQLPFWHSSNWSFGSHCEQNKRQHMEDRFAAVDLTGTAAFSTAHRAGFFAVYDGHSGHEAAEYLQSHLQAYILAAGPDALTNRPLQVLKDAVQQAECELLASCDAGRGSDSAGSTLCAILLVDDKLHVAHVGDSRAVLGRGVESIQLTRDHKPACCIEAARIVDDDPDAEISGDGYMYGELAVARAIGSAAWKRDPSRRALIPTPELVSIQLQPEDDFVLLATDGLWDKVDNPQAVAATRRSLARQKDAETAARVLVERAQRLESTDNITVVTLLLHGRAIAMPKSNSMLFKRSAALTSSLSATPGLLGTDSPPGCSTPCSGASTPVSGATPRSSTPVRGQPLISTTSAPATAVSAAAAVATAPASGPSAVVTTQRSLPPPLPARPHD